MAFYTKNGDGGFSSLSSGMKISKSDERFDVLGTLDELGSFINNCRVIVACEKLNGKLQRVQSTLKEISSAIRFPNKPEFLPTEKEITFLEEQIDKTLASFESSDGEVGKCELSSRLSIVASVCKRLERNIISVDKKYGVHNQIKKYVNRLCDFFLVLAKRIDYDYEKGNLSSIVVGETRKNQEIDEERIYREVLKRVAFGKEINLEKARELSKRVRQRAKEIGLNAVVAVANANGRPILVEVMDDAYLVSFDVAIKKAYTSAAVKMSTQKLSEEVKDGGSLKGLESEEQLIYLGGGEPLKVGWEVVGAIGVSGGTAKEDSELALYGAKVFEELFSK